MRRLICGVKLAGLLVFAIVGCSKNEEKYSPAYSDYVEINARLTNVVSGAEKKIADMAPGDVIVAVNGYPLTKEDFDRAMAIEAKMMMSQKGASEYVVGEKLKEDQQFMVPNFVRLRLLIDDAKRRNVVDSNLVFDVVNEKIMIGAKGKKKTIEQFIKSFPCDIKYICYDLAAKVWVNALIATNIPPKHVVDDSFVKAIQDQVTADNKVTQATNEMLRAKMSSWRAEILAGKRSFGAVAKEKSQDYDERDKIQGYWGDFERGEMQNKSIQAVVFNMKVGDISEPLEDEDGYHIVKVLKATPPVKNAKGRIVQKEIRTLAHIYCEKEPEIIRQSDELMFRDMKRQMQLQAIGEYVEGLKTNGLNTIVYPHGEKFF